MFKQMKLDSEINKMIQDINQEILSTRAFTHREHFDERVMRAMRNVPRHDFVSDEQRPMAYFNGPLMIGHGQTISQPYIVALMSDLLALDKNSIVLEVGTGSGYQTAVLASLTKKVYTMEIIPELLEEAKSRFSKLNYKNIETCIADGHNGWTDYAPYDGIIVTAAADEIPTPLVEQLKPGGKLVIPVGRPYEAQELVLLTKDAQGNISRENVLAVAFVPLVKIGQPH